MAKGRFIPKNPQKYVGNPNQIIFRSSWELTVMKFFDNSTAVRRWNSEEVAIQYISPYDNRPHKYYPDFLCEMINKQGVSETWIIEVKPLKETSLEYAKNDYDKKALILNEAKWKAAEKFAIIHGMKFKVITELDIYRMIPPKKPKKKVGVKKVKRPVGTKKTVGTKTTVRAK
jgi:hypothetical protein